MKLSVNLQVFLQPTGNLCRFSTEKYQQKANKISHEKLKAIITLLEDN